MANLAVLVGLFLAPTTFSANLPSSFSKCNRKDDDFDQCLMKAVENAVHQLNKPIKEVGLPTLEPLYIPKLVIQAGSGPVGFQQNCKDLEVSGLTNIRFSSAKFNFSEKKISLEAFLPHVIIAFNYEISGKVLMLPILGKSNGTITLDKLKASLAFDLEETVKKDEKHFKVVEKKLDLSPELIRFDLEDLFDGDKALRDSMLQVLNDNWKEVFADVKPSYEEAFGQVFASIFNRLLSKVPVKNLFI